MVGKLFHSSDEGVSIFCVHIIDLKNISVASSRESFTPLKNAMRVRNLDIKNTDCLTVFESYTTKSAGGLESQMC